MSAPCRSSASHTTSAPMRVRPRGLASWNIAERARSTAAAAGVPAAGTWRPLWRPGIGIARVVASVLLRVPRASCQRKDPRLPARVPLGPDVVPSLAAFPSSPTGLPPGAGNEADKAEKAKSDEPEEVEGSEGGKGGGGGEVAGGDRGAEAHGHVPTVRRDDDGDELAALVRQVHASSPGWAVRGV